MSTLIRLFIVLPIKLLLLPLKLIGPAIKLLVLPLKVLGAVLSHPKLALGAVALGAAAVAAVGRDA